MNYFMYLFLLPDNHKPEFPKCLIVLENTDFKTVPRILILHLHFCFIAVVVTEVLRVWQSSSRFLGDGKELIILCCLILEASGRRTGNVESSYWCKKIKIVKKNPVSSKLPTVKEAEWCIFEEGGKALFTRGFIYLWSIWTPNLSLVPYWGHCDSTLTLLALRWQFCKALEVMWVIRHTEYRIGSDHSSLKAFSSLLLGIYSIRTLSPVLYSRFSLTFPDDVEHTTLSGGCNTKLDGSGLKEMIIRQRHSKNKNQFFIWFGKSLHTSPYMFC